MRNLQSTPTPQGQIRNPHYAIRNCMIRFIYNLLWPIGLLFFLPGYFVKMARRGGYREKFGQRLGIYDRQLRACLSKQKSTWLHAVSVGLVDSRLKKDKALPVFEPDIRCVVTTTT